MTVKLSELDATSQAAGLKSLMQPVLDANSDTSDESAVAAMTLAVGYINENNSPNDKRAHQVVDNQAKKVQ